MVNSIINNFKSTYIKILFLCHKLILNSKCFKFQCNICGKTCIAPEKYIVGREVPSCSSCMSNRRFRTLIAGLSIEIYGKAKPIYQFERKHFNGLGMSDSEIYAGRLADKLNYTNTFYHKEPFLDITNIKENHINSFDFIITSDVFEHIPQPVESAFNNLYKLLKPNGIVIFSVPYVTEGQTIEHFPNLFEYKIVEEHGKKVLYNTTKQGAKQVYKNLRFHGGDGATLEMRCFSENSLLELIHNTGFTDIKIHNQEIHEFGILFNYNGSHVISMRKPIS